MKDIIVTIKVTKEREREREKKSENYLIGSSMKLNIMYE